MKDSNIGQTGFDSIRLAGMRIQDLPIAEAAHAKMQIPLVLDNERKSKINNILKTYPSQRVDYLEARIKEAEKNINKIQNQRVEMNAKISEYNSLITMCKFRDDEISRISDDDSEKESKIKDLYKRFPPYNVEAMETQIKQFQDTLEVGESVIAKEHADINEMRELVSLCRKRDSDLKSLGAKIA